jgi:transposase-like protein
MTQKHKITDGKKVTVDEAEMKSVLMDQKDFLVPVVQEAVQAMLEVEMEECLQAGKHERNEQRLGYRSGYYRRRLITRVGTMVLRVPQDRAGHFSTQVFEQYQRSEKALVGALAQMYVQGVSTRKVAAITEELCGHEFSASSISAITARLDGQLEEFSRRPLRDAYPYVIVDARYERVREGGLIVSRAILIALGIDWEGRRQVLAVEYANRESRSSWKDFLMQLKERGLSGVQFVVSDDHPGLRGYKEIRVSDQSERIVDYGHYR